jgi:hypothetical protein
MNARTNPSRRRDGLPGTLGVLNPSPSRDGSGRVDAGTLEIPWQHWGSDPSRLRDGLGRVGPVATQTNPSPSPLPRGDGSGRELNQEEKRTQTKSGRKERAVAS